MSWWDFGADPHARPRRGAHGSRRWIWLAAGGGALACAALAGFAFWRASAGPAVPAAQIGMVRWHNWRTVRYRERIKPGVAAIRRAFAAVTGPAAPGPAWRPGGTARAAGR